MLVHKSNNKARWFGLTGLGSGGKTGTIKTGIPEIDNLDFPPEYGGTDTPLPTNDPGIYIKQFDNSWEFEQFNPATQQWEIKTELYSTMFGMGSLIVPSVREGMYASQAIMDRAYGSYSYVGGVGHFTPNGWYGATIYPVQGLRGRSLSGKPVSQAVHPLRSGQWVLDAMTIFCKTGSLRRRQEGDVPIPPVTFVPEVTNITRDQVTDNWAENISIIDVTVGWIDTSGYQHDGPIFDYNRVNTTADLLYGYNYPAYYYDTDPNYFLKGGTASTNRMDIGFGFKDTALTIQPILNQSGVYTGWSKILKNGVAATLDDVKTSLLQGTYANMVTYTGREGAGAVCGFKIYGGGN